MKAHAPLEPTPVGTLGDYQLLKKLGQGGMAEVYLAYRREPAGCGTLSVVKRLRSDLAHRTRWQQMLLGEAKVATRLNHPNIVQTYDVGEQDGAGFITMEYLEGKSLGQLMGYFRHRNHLLPFEIVCFIMAELLDGLHHVHTMCDFDGSPLNIVHRDVSPQNLFVTYTGQAKLLDFGVAQASILTQDNGRRTIKGKLAYLAPEQARQQEIDHRADLWGAGVVLWEALAGRRLFRGATKVETLANSLTAPIPSLCELNPAVPPALDRLVQRALSRRKDQRLPTAEAFSRGLRPFAELDGRPLQHADVAAFLEHHHGDTIRRERDEFQQLLRTATAGPPMAIQPPLEPTQVPPPWFTEFATETLLESSSSASTDEPLSVSLCWPPHPLTEPVSLLEAYGTAQGARPPLSWSDSARMLLTSMLCALATCLLFFGLYWAAPGNAPASTPPPAVFRRAPEPLAPPTGPRGRPGFEAAPPAPQAGPTGQPPGRNSTRPLSPSRDGEPEPRQG